LLGYLPRQGWPTSADRRAIQLFRSCLRAAPVYVYIEKLGIELTGKLLF